MKQNFQKSEIKKELIIEKLRAHGCRMTVQRRLLLDVILEQECVSCKEIYYKANALDPSIGTATVYRMVNLLEEIGVLNRGNIYKMFIDAECENECLIEFDDGSFCELKSSKWFHVLEEGLKACGYENNKKIVSVIMN